MTDRIMTDRTMVILMGIAGVVLIGFGALLDRFYCDYRRSQDMELTHEALANGKLSESTLSEVVPGRLVLYQQEVDSLRRVGARKVALSPQQRDSLRLQRWTSP